MFDLLRRNPVAFLAVLGCSLLLNLILLLTRHSSNDSAVVQAPSAPSAAAPVASAPAAKPLAETEVARTPAAQVPAGQAATDTTSPDGWKVLHAKVQDSLARTFQVEAGDAGDALASVYTRLFVWDLDLRRDMQSGDSLAVVWREGADGIPLIAAANLQSRKLGRTVTAYRWQAPGDPFPSYWHPDGSEAPLRLKECPLTSYEQITSLLKDRPTHKGMDFKTPLGSEVHAPRGGTVTRVNWNWGANGNCIEIRYADGVLAKFLHLSENRVKEGDRVSAGQIIALTGNTGHSTAPHLHYQLNRDEKVLDPLDYHGTTRRSLTAEQVATMKRDVSNYDGMLGGEAAVH